MFRLLNLVVNELLNTPCKGNIPQPWATPWVRIQAMKKNTFALTGRRYYTSSYPGRCPRLWNVALAGRAQ